MSESKKVNIAKLIEDNGLNELVKKASANLEAEGGSAFNAIMYVQTFGDESSERMGCGMALVGETNLTEPLTTAYADIVKQGFEIDREYLSVVVTMIDKTRFGAARAAQINPENYVEEGET